MLHRKSAVGSSGGASRTKIKNPLTRSAVGERSAAVDGNVVAETAPALRYRFG
jgi:hypothetical protein